MMSLACCFFEQKPLLDVNTCRVSLSLLDIKQEKIFKMYLQGTFVIIPFLFLLFHISLELVLNMQWTEILSSI